MLYSLLPALGEKPEKFAWYIANMTDVIAQPRPRVSQALFTLLMDAREYPGIG